MSSLSLPIRLEDAIEEFVLRAARNEFSERCGVSPPVHRFCTGKLTHAARLCFAPLHTAWGKLTNWPAVPVQRTTGHFRPADFGRICLITCSGYSDYFCQIDCGDASGCADNNRGKDFSQSAKAGDCSFEDITEGLKKMRKHTILAKAASIAVCFGILLSNTASAFEGGPAPVARDVELTGDGTLYGQIYTSEGRVVENAPIELRYQGTTVARAMTGANGDFAITGVRGGAHNLTVGAATTSVRLWKNGTAPAGSVDSLVLAGDENVVRGQACDEYGNPCSTCPPPSSGFGLIDVVTLAMLATSVTALVFVIDTQNDVDDLKDALVSP